MAITYLGDVSGVHMSIVDATLLMFTDSYPYGYALEDTFLEPQLRHLSAEFRSVVLVPFRRKGNRAAPPGDFEVEEGLAALGESPLARSASAVRALLTPHLWRDLRETPAIIRRPRALLRLLSAATRADLTSRWIIRYVRQRILNSGTVVAYTFWCNGTTTGLALAKSKLSRLTVVSRAHGVDLYAERHDPPFLPLRAVTLEGLDRLYPDSEIGVRYVVERYPWFAGSCELARLGVPDPGFTTAPSTDGHVRVISCSRVVPIKRVELILGGIDHASRLRPDLHFEWHHFGDGPLRSELASLASARFGDNATARFWGYSGISDLMEFYRTNPLDVFVNASASEGTPVAMMEAASCGIPIVATAVGGNVEVVSEENGYLVSADPRPDEIAGAILNLYERREASVAKRAASRRVWELRYNEASNYREFAARLSALADPKADELGGHP